MALYRDGRTGRLPTADVSRLTPLLALIATLLRDQDLEERVARLEETADAAR